MLESIYDSNDDHSKKKELRKENKNHARTPNIGSHQKYSLDELDDYLHVDRDRKKVETIQQNIKDEQHTFQHIENDDIFKKGLQIAPTDARDDDDIEMILDNVENSFQPTFRSAIPIDNSNQEFISTGSPQPHVPTCFVIDTNFIISHLDILETLRSLFTQYHHTIIIPRYTIRELDGLKTSDRVIDNCQNDNNHNRYRNVGEAARAANRWIYGHLANTASGVIGQKLSQRININAIKDDSILDCCLYFKERQHCFVILLSNDKNLCLKALTEEVLTVSYRKGTTGELIAKIAYEESKYRFGSMTEQLNPSLSDISTECVPVVSHTELTELPFTETSAYIFEEVRTMVIESTKYVMLDEYGDTLEFLDYDPNSLRNLAEVSKCMYTYWVSVFSEYFRGSNLTKESWKDLPIDLTSVPKQKDTLRVFQQFWSDILVHLFIKRAVAECEKLQMITEGWERAISNTI
ncbi:similar to Saccharomyces cerevisiae YOR166C SWT1 RNA endoribonuclease involved in perinuclear mRNP quality control via the turnover of aberrant, unprocessed pre-mRNAs [Maudiozyma saulgeensis]|uniref:Transcriptional protein SWT1 n=1 Tax=Maudiozyma saulgeensis TaxID=1789683 RepID=A0A1X7RBC6_9SACH|nr:similar to Saccharomyces cerevisiae YOR166C SWT1 RNA endoribonuclease involved in perinuclear mRNP quality control via the turnover of aberrant, unprocessed pre-mRNAs [Kazachstania saulgeensis]